ncbi:MAG: hypothetical protein BV457_00110 [Thermoplasmata archaeon M9B1D]|nr:MAG: hypothetical protein BV457_00110 [Thermoplasmata archaeon M9B1D]PNX52232.1 MAG: hypothetical protein BV456_00185 [Thermoplasmata archaeon M8B2D]
MKGKKTIKNNLIYLKKLILFVSVSLILTSCVRNTGITDFCLLDEPVENTCPLKRDFRRNKTSIRRCRKENKDFSKERCLRELYPAVFDTEKTCKNLDKHNNLYYELCE